MHKAPVHLFVFLTLLGSLAIGCGGAERDDGGQIVSGGSLDVFEVRVGDCFEDPSDPLTAESIEVGDLSAVPCAEPHDNEAYHDFDLAPGPWPGDEAVFAEADRECYEQFESYVGSSYVDSRLDFSYLYPTQQSWQDGDREVICFLFAANLEKLTGSKRDSGE